MKIVCVGRNYVAHALELQNEVPDEPVLFIKPETAYLKYDAGTFAIPSFTQDLHYECEIVLKVGAEISHVEAKDALGNISEITLGVDFTARDVQSQLKEKKLPWEKAKAFDHAAVVGDFIPFTEKYKTQPLHFTLSKNGALVQKGDSSLMIFPFAVLIAHISQYFTLMPGDLIYTGTPAGVGKVNSKDHFIGKLEEKTLFDFQVQ